VARNFSPEESRGYLVGPDGLARQLAHRFEDSKAVAGLGAHARSDVNTAIECLLVGFDEPARQLLETAGEWIRIAISANERPERYFPGGTEASRWGTLTLCDWLLSNEHDAESYRRYAEFEDRYLSDRSVARDKAEVSYVLPVYADAGMFERGMEIFHATPGLSPPSSTNIAGEGRMSYVVSRHRLGLQYNRAELEAMATRFLRRNVDGWLADGHWSRAARWMKIIHWNGADPPISATDALLKCYDYLPGREPTDPRAPNRGQP
jgi:hypothetical protein